MSVSHTTLGIDLGTQSIKILFYDYENRKTVFSSSSELDLDQDASGKAEQQADWWIDALLSALEEAPTELKESVRALSVSGQQHGFVALDRSGNVLAPVKLWCDTTTQRECSEIMDRMGGEDRCLELSGNKILVGFTASKVLALKKSQPEVYQQLDTILLPHDYLNFWLSGERSMEFGDASGTGFLNIHTREWSSDVLYAIDSERDLKDCLPPLLDSTDLAGKLSETAAQQTGLTAGIPIAVGGGDNMMGAIGTGNLSVGRTTISLGTSGTAYAYADHPVIDDAGNISAFCSSTGGWMPLLCTMNCTVTTELARKLLNLEIADFDNALNQAEIGSSGIITLPFFNGERTPNLPNAKGCIIGLDSNNMTPENLLRSAVEGASFALKFGVDELARLGVKTEQIVLTGGGSNSPAWRQIIADVMNAEVLIMRNNEGAAFGAALQAFATLNSAACTREFLADHYEFDESKGCKPRPENVAAYSSAYRGYSAAVKQVSPFFRPT